MKLNLHIAAMVAAGALLVMPPAIAQTAPSAAQIEKVAYLTGMDIYTFGFPLVHMELLRYEQSNNYRNKVTPYHSLGDWYHNTIVLDHDWKEGGTPNIDTFYSSAWVDLSKEPVILSHPDMGERYFAFQLTDYFSDTFDYVGQRATGSKAGAYALIGPDWEGELPAGVTALKPAITNNIFILGRTLYDKDKADQETAYGLMKQYRLTPLSQWHNREQYHATKRDWIKAPKPAVDALDPTSNPLGHWQAMLDALARFPTPEKHRTMINLMKNLGLTPGMNIENDLDEATKKGLAQAAIDGFQKLKIVSTKLGALMNGWMINPAEYGDAGLHGEYLLRASSQSLAGIVANTQEEAVYIFAATDENGKPLSGSQSYQVHFSKEQLPPAKAFWSITNYDMQYNFVTNKWKKYELGDRNEDLVYDDQGGLTIYYSSKPPKDERLMPNWLPTPEQGNFYTVIRVYVPDQKLIDRWNIPPLESVEQ